MLMLSDVVFLFGIRQIFVCLFALEFLLLLTMYGVFFILIFITWFERELLTSKIADLAATKLAQSLIIE